MNEGSSEAVKSWTVRRLKRNDTLWKDRSSRLNLIRSGGPLVVVALAGLLLCCNVLWLYSTGGHIHRGICSFESVVWGSQISNDSASHLDYQRVQGSGRRDVPIPIPIPNDTVLLGSDASSNDDGEKLRFMTIGISSVWRKDNYLYRTLDSIIKETSEEEKLDVYVFLLLADADPHKRYKRAKSIESRYKAPIENGFLRVLQPPSSIYPSIDFSRIRRTYSDSVERVQWRTKQVLDFVFLFWYTWTRQPSLYYLVLEDDVLSAKHFVSAAKDFVELHKSHHWVALQLAGFLGIGQLIRCKDLDRLVSFLLLFYTEHPVDILFNHWVSLMAPDKPPKDRPMRRVPGLFQHIGVHSTLANKTQTLRDSTFSLVKRRFSHVNPSADVVTTIRQYKSFVPELAYSSAPGMFWGIPRPKDTFDIVFPQPLQLARLFITTGTYIHNKRKIGHLRDKLTYGHVEVSTEFLKMENTRRASCTNFEFLRGFKNGDLDFRGFPEIFPEGIQCIRIVIDPPQKTWVAISEIAVFTMDEANPEMLQQEPEKGAASNGSTSSSSINNNNNNIIINNNNNNNINNNNNNNKFITNDNIFRLHRLPNSILKNKLVHNSIQRFPFSSNTKTSNNVMNPTNLKPKYPSV